MPIRQEMHNLAQEIIRSYDGRIQGVAQIRKITQAQLREFDKAHEAMARAVRADLKKGRSHLAATVATQRAELSARHRDGQREWHNLSASMDAKRSATMAAPKPPTVGAASPRPTPKAPPNIPAPPSGVAGPAADEGDE